MATTVEPHPPRPKQSSRNRLGLRTRLLLWFVVLLGAALLISMVVIRSVLVNDADRLADAQLNASAEDFRLAVNDAHLERSDAPTLSSVMDRYLAGRVAQPDRGYLTLIDGKPYAISAGAPVALDKLDGIDAWGALLESHNGVTTTAAGPTRWLAIPITSQGKALGTLVVLDFVGARHDEVSDTIRSVGFILGVVFLVAALVAWGSAGRAVRPLRRLSATAHSVSSGSDLAGRLEVKGHDEVAELAVSFNGMMQRLEHAFDSQKQFLDNAGHELRTPLTIVRGHLELLDVDEDPDERAATIALVLDELDRMDHLVEELRQLARSERPDFVKLAPVSVSSLTEELNAKAVALADRAFVVDQVAETEVLADRARLTEAMMNLIENAVNVTQPGGTIGIGSSVDGNTVRLWVRDTGPGIPEDLQPLLFRPGEERPAELRRPGGTGLGILLALAIARAHGGTVAVASRLGEGATFAILLPLDETGLTSSTTGAAGVPSSPTAEPPGDDGVDFDDSFREVAVVASGGGGA